MPRLHLKPLLFVLFLLVPGARCDYCDDAERMARSVGRVPSCPECTQAVHDSKVVKCAYCLKPHEGMAHCQAPLYPPPSTGLPLHPCYNATAGAPPLPPFYRPRCSQEHCMMDQCHVPDRVLRWWHVLLLGLLGFVLVALGTYYLCVNCVASYWFSRAERRDEERRFLQTQERVAAWNAHARTLHGKYYGAVPDPTAPASGPAVVQVAGV
eukprot:m.24719 g.24719  ORF g.24719 m.24719 type:complete len:210 (+) comp8745_c0_seq2:314-943(+)